MKMYWEACALLGGTCNKKKTCSGAYQISLCSDGLYMIPDWGIFNQIAPHANTEHMCCTPLRASNIAARRRLQGLLCSEDAAS